MCTRRGTRLTRARIGVWTGRVTGGRIGVSAGRVTGGRIGVCTGGGGRWEDRAVHRRGDRRRTGETRG